MLVNNEDPDLRPRQRDPFTGADHGADERAFLQHDIHAEALYDHFVSHFEEKLALPYRPKAVHIVVYSRFDSEVLLAPAVTLHSEHAEHGLRLMHLFNMSGSGVSGVHYDPLFLSAEADAAESEGEGGIDAGTATTAADGESDGGGGSEGKRRRLLFAWSWRLR